MAASAPNGQTTLGPYGFGFMNALLFGREAQNPHLPPGAGTNAIIGNKTTLDTFSQRHSSLLSEISVLNSMTASPWLNKTIIDVLEGLIITLFVVVAFILVFLIREWVVQQQPLLALEQNAPLRDVPPLGAADAGHRPDPVEVERPVPNDGPVEEGPLVQPLVQPARERQGSEDAEVPQERTNPHDAEVSTETEEAGFDGGYQHEERHRLTSMEHFVASYWFDDSHLDADEKALQQSSVGRVHNIGKAIASLSAEDQYLLHKKTEEWETFDLRLKRSELHLEDQLIPLQSMVLSHTLIKDYGDVSGSNTMGKIAAELIESLPLEARETLREALQTENDVSKVFEKLSAEDKELVREKVAEWCAILHAYNGSDQYTEAQPESSRALQRPAMPLRGESFKAAEIQRTLEEESTAPDDPELSGVSHPLRDPDAEAEHDSVESDESVWSWQNVNDAEKAETQTSDPFPGSSRANLSSVDPPAGSRSEGKAKTNPESARSDGLVSEQPSASPLLNHDSKTAPLTGSTNKVNAASSDSDSPHTSITKAWESGGQPGSESSDRLNHTMEAASVAQDDSYWATPADASTAATNSESGNRPHGRTENPGEGSILVQPPAQGPIAAQQPLIDRFLDWFWGGVPAVDPAGNGADEDEDHIVHEIAEEAPFVQLPPADEPVDPGAAIPDPEVLAAAAQAGLDLNEPEPLDIDDELDGIGELVGMQGPIINLFQNAMFSSVLISATVACIVWLPYLWGKVVLLFLGNPVQGFIKLPLHLASVIADLVVDLCLTFGGFSLYATIELMSVATLGVSWMFPSMSDFQMPETITNSTRFVCKNAMQRIGRTFIAAGIAGAESDLLDFSLQAHQALRDIQGEMSDSSAFVAQGLVALCHNLTTPRASLGAMILQAPAVLREVKGTSLDTVQHFATLVSSTFKTGAMTVTVGSSNTTRLMDPTLAYWTAMDRIYAVLAGWALVALCGALYLKMDLQICSSENGKKIEGMISDSLKQAGGVLKVILIISIEMIVFPLYCGMLLDFALLPLFQDATAATRLEFAMRAPWTAGFVHWFVGTCYMFHFALFVSMCRKIMRSGVLYFIRDPDDPTFHPVRDVLERNVSTQLRKITVSALVYGALVIVCLGGVVWSLCYVFEGILPIRWTSNKPVLEFPIDLLLYNFLTPVVLKFFRPSHGLNVVYEWWFRKCARALRLSHFLFGERREDEEGHYVPRIWSRFVTGEEKNEEGDETPPSVAAGILSVEFRRDGRYVRAPASDQVRIPKGREVFLDVDEENMRLDGGPDEPQGMHGYDNEQFTRVYIPPWFRLRIGLFIAGLWAFAAATGVGATIVPLLLGRQMSSISVPDELRMNDIYAFSIGVYSLGALIYCVLHYEAVIGRVRSFLSSQTVASAMRNIRRYTFRAVKMLYLYTTFTIILPSLLALCLELYFIIPLHTYYATSSPSSPSSPQSTISAFPSTHNTKTTITTAGTPLLVSQAPSDHVIHIIQDWTLGLLYLRIGTSVLLTARHTRLARALRAIVLPGWLNPNAALATRVFIVPLALAFALILLGPSVLVRAAVRLRGVELDPVARARVHRYAYPVCAACCGGAWAGVVLVRAVRGWRRRIRDEVYLIGERLHNFGERRGVGGEAKT
ncbi:hypothetical protein B0A49_10601 [Cryomyces minteri]|uniref:RING-type E3 ubiquitin transferase n=1 Tax=Cryomyces minteri TaxID=331657 RepID=A0A4U0WT91_9PEZI|nr:hypothetical protein B0A49_10601 [Cryomyces minteri]